MNFRYHGGHRFLRVSALGGGRRSCGIHPQKIPLYIKKELVPIMEKGAQENHNHAQPKPGYEMEKVVLPQIASIKQASNLMGLPPHYLRRLCKEVPGLAFQSGVKWYINLGRLADYYNNHPME